MANSNPTPNPDIAKLGEDSQFGKPGGADPRKAQEAAWSIRAQLRHLATQALTAENEEDLNANLKRLRKDGNGEMTVARLFAVRMIEKGLKKMEPAMANTVIENIEGKLSQEIRLPNREKAPTDFTEMGDAEALYKKYIPG